MLWPQDIIAKPVTSLSAHENPQLATIGREAYTYVVECDNVGISPNVGQITATFAIELTCDFIITNISTFGFDPSTQLPAQRQGNISIRDNATNYYPIQNVPLGTITPPNRPSLRTILPMSYAIGAGGSFTVIIDFPPLTGGARNVIQQANIEGWRNFRFVEGDL